MRLRNGKYKLYILVFKFYQVLFLRLLKLKSKLYLCCAKQIIRGGHGIQFQQRNIQKML